MRRWTALSILGALAACSAACDRDARGDEETPVEYREHREPLSTGNLYVPAAYAPKSSAIDLVVHFHGADWVTEQEHDRAGRAAALVTINYSGLSSAYGTPFNDPLLFGQVLDEAVAKTGAVRDVASPVRGKVVVSSFSAGYGAVRQILGSGLYDAWISDVVLADSLHAGYYYGKPNPAQMTPFVAFAKKAAASEASMLISHSAIVPGSYASTTETADVLIAAAGTVRAAVDLWTEAGMHQTSGASKGGFLVRGFSGATASDHMDHLHNIGRLWELVSLPVR